MSPRDAQILRCLYIFGPTSAWLVYLSFFVGNVPGVHPIAIPLVLDAGLGFFPIGSLTQLGIVAFTLGCSIALCLNRFRQQGHQGANLAFNKVLGVVCVCAAHLLAMKIATALLFACFKALEIPFPITRILFKALP